MRKILMALAATSLVAAPALALQGKSQGAPYGNAYGQDKTKGEKQPKVCLITFDRELINNQGLPVENVLKAQYLPLNIALAKDTMSSLIVTYGANGATGGGIEQAQVQYDDPTIEITPTSTTEEACSAIQEFVELNDDDADEDDDDRD
jgi:hypothetical protein